MCEFVFRIILRFLLFGTGALVLYACVSPKKVVQPEQTRLFRSDEYVVYQLRSNQSPEELPTRIPSGHQDSWIIEEANPDIRFRRGSAVVIPLKVPNKGGLSADGFQTIPILTYHRFADNCSTPLCMPSRDFERQMRYLKENGYHVITAEDFLSFLEYRRRLPHNSVLITMDDGYRSVYNIAYPILNKYGFKATLFVYTSFVGVSKMAITWNQLKEMKANGFTIGSHTIDHTDLTQPKEDETESEYMERIKKELYGSK